MNVLSVEQSKTYENSEFAFVGTPVELKIAGRENVRLQKPVRVNVKIPKGELESLAAEELFYGYYYEGKWDYYIPQSIDLEKGIAGFDIYHFSFLGFGKPSQKQQVKTYANTMAVKAWEEELKKKDYLASTNKQFDDLFSQMGVKSKEARNKLIADVISYVDPSDMGYFDFIAQSTNSGLGGEKAKLEFENKYKEFLGKAIYRALEKDPSSFSSKVNIVGNLASAAGSIAGGDNKAALESIANMLNGMVPASQLAASTSAFIAAAAEETIDYWAKSEIEKAYQVYATGIGSKWGYEDGLKGDFNTIFTLLGGGDRQMDIKIIKKYCERRGMNENDLSDERRNQIIANAKKALKASFDRRITAEAAIEKKKTVEEAFIAQLQKEGPLSSNNFQKYFGIGKNASNFDISSRLDRLYNIKAAILSIMDKDIAETISNEFLVKAVSQWIYWNEKGDRASFYKYMREMGYIKNPAPQDSTTNPQASQPPALQEDKATAPQATPVPAQTKDNEFAWVLVETVNEDAKENTANTNKGGVYQTKASASPGSYTYSSKYIGKTDTYPDPDQINGEGYAMKLDFAVPPKVIKAGETIELNFNLAFTEQNISYFDGNGSCRADFGSTRFTNKDGKSHFAIYCFVKYSNKNVLSLSDKISAKAPSGNKEGQRVELWTGGLSAGIGTRYIYEWKMTN